VKLVMTLLVRDEEDVIAANLLHHLATGVDEILVCDNRSVDATPQIVDAVARATGAVTMFHEAGEDYAQHRWVSAMAERAATELGADWVLHADADEFVLSTLDTLPAALAGLDPRVGAVLIPRLELRPAPDDGRPFHQRMIVRSVRPVNALGQPLRGKLCHRGQPGVILDQGNHTIRGLHGEVALESPLVMFHYPMRTFAQFARKVRLGGEAYERNRELSGAAREPWRTLLRRLRAGELPTYYAEREWDAARCAQAIGDGRAVVDRRMAESIERVVAKARDRGIVIPDTSRSSVGHGPDEPSPAPVGDPPEISPGGCRDVE
jgi:hypothetical protein